MKYLFVGGPADGRRVEVPDGTQYWQFVKVPDILNDVHTEDHTITAATYRKVALRDVDFSGRATDHEVFVPEHRDTPLLGQLIERYPSPEDREMMLVPVGLMEKIAMIHPLASDDYKLLRKLMIACDEHVLKHGQ